MQYSRPPPIYEKREKSMLIAQVLILIPLYNNSGVYIAQNTRYSGKWGIDTRYGVDIKYTVIPSRKLGYKMVSRLNISGYLIFGWKVSL